MTDDSLDSLMKDCLSCASQDDLLATALGALSDSIENMQKNTRKQEIALFLMEKVVIVGRNHVASSARDKCLDACGPHATLCACSQVLLEASEVHIKYPSCLQTCLYTIRRMLLQLDSPLWTNLQEKELMPLALLFPTQIANACHFQRIQLPSWCVKSRYCRRLLECALVSGSTDSCQVLAQKLVHSTINGSDEVAMALHHYYTRHAPNGFEATVLSIMQQLTTSRDVATLLRSILQHYITTIDDESAHQDLDPYLKVVCLPILETSASIREQFLRLTILTSSSCHESLVLDKTFCHSVALILAACQSNDDDDDDESSDEEEENCGPDCSILEQCSTQVATHWSQAVFVQYKDRLLQRHVSLFLTCAISLLDNVDASSRLISQILNGVSLRLSSSLDEVRRDGMRMAELIAERLDQPLRFDELDDERNKQDETDEDKDKATSVDMADKKVPQKTRHRKTRRLKKKVKQPVDPDAEYVSDDSSSDSDVDSEESSYLDDDDDSVWNDIDEPLIPYDLDDDEQDLRETPKPLYLRECLSHLQAMEPTASANESAIQAVASLVRSNPPDLPDLTVPLCTKLLRLENSFDLPDFETHCQEGLLALAVMQPVLAGNCLIHEFFDDNSVGLYAQLSILYTFESAAHELCGQKALEEERKKTNRETNEPRVSGKRELVQESAMDGNLEDSVQRVTSSLESRTRRWGKGRRDTKSFTVTNKLAPVAPSWFYGLVSGFVNHRQDTALWGGANGARLLASFLVTLATIVECCGMGSEVLANDLIDFAWSFHTSKVPEVRTAVLIAIANSLVQLREDALLTVLYRHMDLAEFLQTIALEESDEKSRSIALTLSKNVAQILDNQLIRS